MDQSDSASKAGIRPRTLTGRLDRADRRAISGWALDPFAPQSRVELAIKANGEVIGSVVADQHRSDLEQAGKAQASPRGAPGRSRRPRRQPRLSQPSGNYRLGQDPRDPSRRVGLAVYVDGRVVGRLLADRFRADLRTAGIGDGHHAFEFILPRLSPFARHDVRLTREFDGKNLPGSPFVIEPAGALDAETEAGLAFIAADLSEARVLEAMATVLPKPE